MSSTTSPSASRAELESRALAAERAGRLGEALTAWQLLLSIEPRHLRALTALGFDDQRRGDLTTARDHLTRAAEEAGGTDPTPWINVARLCRLQYDERAEEHALVRAAHP